MSKFDARKSIVVNVGVNAAVNAAVNVAINAAVNAAVNARAQFITEFAKCVSQLPVLALPRSHPLPGRFIQLRVNS